MLILVEYAKLPAWIPIIVLTREFIVSGYRLVAVEKGGTVIAANVWGKVKTALQITAVIMAFFDVNAYGAFVYENLHGLNLIFNILATTAMFLSVIATIFSGWEYIKNGWKELILKN